LHTTKTTASEHLSGAPSWLGSLASPTNIGLSWKVFPRTTALAYVVSSSVTKKKSLITLTPELENEKIGLSVSRNSSRRNTVYRFVKSLGYPYGQ